MNKAVSNRDICFIKAALLLCEHGNIYQQNSKIVFFYHPPMLLGLTQPVGLNRPGELFVGLKEHKNDRYRIGYNFVQQKLY